MQWKKTLFMELTLCEVLLTRFRVVITGKRYDCCIADVETTQ